MDDDRLARGLDALLDTVARESDEITARAKTGGLTDPLRARQEIDLLSWQVEATVAFLRTRASRQPASPAPAPRYRPPTRLRLMIPRVASGHRSLAVSFAVLGLVAAGVAAGWWALQRSVEGPARAVASMAVPPVDVPSASTPSVETRSPARTMGTAGRAVELSTSVADGAPSAAQSEVVAAAEGWLDAYFRQDQQRMATFSAPDVRMSDERAAQERLPTGMSDVGRTVEGATVRHHGAGAVLTAKMIETGIHPVTRQPVRFEAFISQMWTRRAGAWQLHETRIVSAAAVSRAFKR